MGNGAGTHVANSTGRTVCVFYCTDKMVTEEVVTDVDTGYGGSALETEDYVCAARTSKFSLRRNPQVQCFSLPAGDLAKIPRDGDMYISVFFDDDGGDDGDMICYNFFIPSDRSVILTPDYNVRLQKYGSREWEDEEGNFYQ
ncbi:uncharacterized protein LOC144770347 [Lissotriton helveticus]